MAGIHLQTDYSTSLVPRQRQLEQIILPGSVVELRIPGTTCGTISGYYDDLQALIRDADSYSGKVPGIYWTPNPCKPALLARANNRLEKYVKTGQTTSDDDIESRRYML